MDVIAGISPGSAMTSSLVSGGHAQGLGQATPTTPAAELVNSTSSHESGGGERQKTSNSSLFTQSSNGGGSVHTFHQSNLSITPPGMVEPTTPAGFELVEAINSRSNSSHTSSTSSRLSTGFNSLPSHSRQGSADSCAVSANAARYNLLPSIKHSFAHVCFLSG